MDWLVELDPNKVRMLCAACPCVGCDRRRTRIWSYGAQTLTTALARQASLPCLHELE